MPAQARMWRRRQVRVLAAVVAAVAAVLALRTGLRGPVDPTISVWPRTALLDQPVTVSVRGLPPGARTTITATAEDRRGTTWSASAEFRASPDGVVSADQPSLGGSYSGVNPMGLLVFMSPDDADPRYPVFLGPDAGYDVTLEATAAGRVPATATARRLGPAAVGVREKRLRPGDGGIYGNLYLPPATTARRPAVLVFGGAEGGLGRTVDAALLAAHGYPSLALAYFGAPGLRPELIRIPLEYFVRALTVLRAQPGVDPDHVLVMAYSRGAEAALLLGAYFPRLVNGVVAGVPSSVVNPTLASPVTQPSWTLRGRPLPSVGPGEFGQAGPPENPAAAIPVERIRGPILLSCGDIDVVWRSCPYTDEITRRLAAHRFGYPVTALHYPDAGHAAGSLAAYFSLTDDALTSSGGSLAGTQAALADGHTKLLALLASL